MAHYHFIANPTAAGHPRQCQAFRYKARDPLTGDRIRCVNYAKQGEIYCAYHWKHRNKKYKNPAIGIETEFVNAEEEATMPAAYSRHLSQTLRDRLLELEGKSPVELIDLSEELALAKTTMGDVRQLYDLSLLALEQAQPEDQLGCLKACIAAGQLLRDTASEIGDVAGRAAGAMAASRHFLGVQNIPMLVKQMVEIMYDEFGEENAMVVARVAERVKEIRIGQDGPRGTSMTPDMADEEAKIMDASVPFVPKSA